MRPGLVGVPVDASEAAKDPSRREYFFGAHDEHRVEFTRGRDIRLEPAQQGEPLNYFVYPYAATTGSEGGSEFRGRGVGCVDLELALPWNQQSI